MRLPIYLDEEVQRYLSQRAADKGVLLGEMVNGLLKREIKSLNLSNEFLACAHVGSAPTA